MKNKKLQQNTYNSLFDKIAGILTEARARVVRNINQTQVIAYWEIGREIVEYEQKGKARAGYGEELLIRLSKDMTEKFGKGFSRSNLQNMRLVYLTYSKCQTLSGKSNKTEIMLQFLRNNNLSWSHYCELISMEDPHCRQFYEIESAQNNWSVRELKRQINSMLFERIALSKNKKDVLRLAQKGQIVEKAEDAVKNPYVLEFLGLPEKHQYSESQLEQKLIDHMQEFILELGKGFAFVARQKRVTIDNEHYYIDLVFYHRILKCLVLIDLKIGKIDHKDIGQMNFYLNYIKHKEMMSNENNPIGIILCTERDKRKAFVAYALGGITNKIFVSKYKLYLPTKQQLEAEVIKESERLKKL